MIRIPDPKEKKYYFDWAASEFKKTKTLDPEDSYVLNIRMAEAVQWAEQFEKIYKRTEEGYEKDRTDHRNMTVTRNSPKHCRTPFKRFVRVTATA